MKFHREVFNYSVPSGYTKTIASFDPKDAEIGEFDVGIFEAFVGCSDANGAPLTGGGKFTMVGRADPFPSVRECMQVTGSPHVALQWVSGERFELRACNASKGECSIAGTLYVTTFSASEQGTTTMAES